MKEAMEKEPSNSTQEAVQPETYSVRRINRIAKHVAARSYLEVGVARGLTFNQLAFERKVAVDPAFRFDVADYKKDGVEFCQETSDRFFSRQDFLRKFDLIFLDGLHTFQQTFRDFCCSQAFAHSWTVWLIDDVIPSDVYSAWPVETEAYQFRKRGQKGDNRAWHGDVFKVVFAIHDFFPTLSYVTLVGSGNPQTIVWRSGRGDFSPLFSGMEAIERLGYFDYLKRERVFNPMTEEEGLGTFCASWSGHFPQSD